MKSGLYAFAGDSATAKAAACAKRLDEPMTNVSNVYRSFSRDSVPGVMTGVSGADSIGALAGRSRGGAAGGGGVDDS